MIVAIVFILALGFAYLVHPVGPYDSDQSFMLNK